MFHLKTQHAVQRICFPLRGCYNLNLQDTNLNQFEAGGNDKEQKKV
jgi:hypothetical protein